jgi:hypothetical protein
MSSNENRFAGVERGKPLPGSKAIARHIWEDEEKGARRASCLAMNSAFWS